MSRRGVSSPDEKAAILAGIDALRALRRSGGDRGGDTVEDTDTSYQELRGQFGAKVADIVAEVTDTKWLQKGSRKRLQISKASKPTEGARLVKLADKIANLRDIITSPPADWSLARKREYFDWAKQVVDQVRGTNLKLERRFDSLYRKRP